MTAVVEAMLAALPAILLVAIAGWVASLLIGKASIVDSLWPLFFVVAGAVYLDEAPEPGSRGFLVGVLLLAWALRLGVYITARNYGEPEDRRYQALREKFRPFAWKSLYVVFGLQALLAWVISWPLMFALGVTSSPTGLTWLDVTALALWIVGMVFEAGGDWQLARFKRDRTNAGRVLDKGLWRYTRHPNYFGEFCIWWAFFLFALAAGGWWTIVSPLLMTVLLLRVSGVALLERTMKDRRPAYEDYIARTNAFFPGPPGVAGANGGRAE